MKWLYFLEGYILLNELDKNGLSINILQELSYESKMGKSLVNIQIP